MDHTQRQEQMWLHPWQSGHSDSGEQQRRRFQLMAQFEPQVPDSLRDHVPGIEPEQRARSVEVIRRQILANGHESLTQFFPIASIPAVAKRAEPGVAMGLRNGCSDENNLSAFASLVARRIDVIQPTGCATRFIAEQ